MRKIFSARSIILAMICMFTLCFTNLVSANENQKEIIVKLNDEKILINESEISKSLDDDIYLSTSTNNGGISDKAINENIEIANVITINKEGIYRFTGNLSDGQIAINANDIKGTVKVVLDNANITCKSAPAIFVYSKDLKNENCKVIISPKENTESTVTGTRIKVSVLGWEDQDKILYNIEKDYDDEDGSYFERYKYDGAISSDISLTFNGKGTLNVISTKKEGIEGKMHIIFEDGIYNILAMDDCINASSDRESRIEINGGTVICKISDDAEEGDGIDSNGSLTINGGKVISIAHPGADNGLDADLGVVINGGTILATGSMPQSLKTDNDTKYVQMNLSQKINKDENLIITDSKDKFVFAYKAEKEFTTFTYGADNLNDDEYKAYTGDIKGTLDENNIYTNVEDFNVSKLSELSHGNAIGFGPGMSNMQNNSNKILNITFIIIAVILIIALVIINVKKDSTKLLSFVNLIVGLIAGCLITISIMNFINANRFNKMPNFNQRQDMFMGEMPQRGGNRDFRNQGNILNENAEMPR